MSDANLEASQQFLAAMQSRDLALSEGQQLVADGRWHRCDATNNGDGKNDGSYKLCLDGPAPWGLFRNWTDGKDVEYWRGGPSRPLTETEQQELERRIEQQRIAHEKDATERAAQARDKAQAIWAGAKDAPGHHPYLKAKKIAPHGVRVSKYDQLLVPMYDPGGTLVNLQFIDDDGSKWFLKGGRTKGCYFRIPGKIGPVVATEGFATAASINEAIGCFVLAAFSASNLAAVATLLRKELNSTEAAIWKAHTDVAGAQDLEHERRPTFLDVEIIVAADDDWKTEGNPGLLAAINAGRVARARVAVPTFETKDRGERDTDFNDIACLYGKKAVEEDIAKAADPDALLEKKLLDDPHSAHAPTMLKELAALKQSNVVRYEEFLAALKKKKVRVGVLDREIKGVIKTAADQSAPEKADELLLPHWIIEPWGEPVNTGDLLHAITQQISRYVATLENRALVPALWTMGSYVHEAATHSPLLLVTSPEADSGKSTLLGVIGFLAKRALLSVSISGPALFRSLTKWQPTFIVDEADTALVRNDDLKEVMNSGWTRGQGVIRCDPETNNPRLYPTFAPKAIGMKGKKLPDTTLTRAIIIEMKRKQPGEVVQDFDHLDNDDFRTLRRKLVCWAADNINTLRKAKPQTPPKFHNRTRMNWWLLLAIAELAGDDIAARTREAAVAIEQAKDKGQQPYGTLLLADLRAMFERKGIDAISSKDIVDELKEDLEAPWATYTKNDKPMTQRHLAALLRPFGIVPGSVYPDRDDPDPVLRRQHLKGYARSQFEEAWTRYLRPDEAKPEDADEMQPDEKSAGVPPEQAGKRVNPSSTGTTEGFASGSGLEMTRIENDELSYGHGDLPVTRIKNPAPKQKFAKGRFRYDPQKAKAERLARARVALEESGDRNADETTPAKRKSHRARAKTREKEKEKEK
jgi:putative DNA primase/helicase